VRGPAADDETHTVAGTETIAARPWKGAGASGSGAASRGADGGEDGSQPRGEAAPRRLACDGTRVLDVIDIAQLRQLSQPQTQRAQPRPLGLAGTCHAHRNPKERARLGPAQTDRPIAAIRRAAQAQYRDVRFPKPGNMPAPPGPFRREAWRSPLRGPWLTSVLDLVRVPTLLAGLPVLVAPPVKE